MAVFMELIVVSIILVVCLALGRVFWVVMQDVMTQTQDKLQKKNINVSTSGATVGVKGRSQERVADSTQKYLVEAWGNSETKGYSSSWFAPKNKPETKAKKAK
ncbi:hypothetical protein BCR37DRAFT_394219 [Protomyces lactucae-debilis]|uniref:Uncharacterized protein n=1 Tax=Protomyces lactucae-debilis TaxID=2754530 RepID=A0A1Y2F768_PROLT|nr:uncharacterized protein BCR37DRAFT_394219 [Protomyces lactucae-debilis]ORY79497.1 hypothetical protein BCR37DRAFT_394219 [Protomyces lactucae-debilis]